MTCVVRLFLSPSGAIQAGTWLLCFCVQSLVVFGLTRPLAAAAQLDAAPPSGIALSFAACSLLILWSIVATTLKRLRGMGLSTQHLVWVAGLWLLAAFFGGSGDPVGILLHVLNLATLVWLALPPALLRFARREA
jgi:uncharacterized membrane protein YhaH (DUF805 family)